MKRLTKPSESFDHQLVSGVVCVVLLALAALPVRAGGPAGAQVAATDLTELSLEELMNIEITSASKKAERIVEAPASVFVITREDIRRYGYRKLGEAVRQVAGVYLSSDYNFEYLGIRGFARPGDYNTRLLLLIDGHRLNDAMFDYAPVGEDFGIDIESVERIEVVKGPGSSLWGTNALLAVINVVSRKGGDINGTRAVAEHGSHSRARMFIEHGSMSEKGLEIACGISEMDSDGRGRIYFPEFDDPSTNYGVAEGLDGEEAERAYLTASYGGLTLFLNKARRWKSIPTGSYQTLFNVPGTFTHDQWSRVDLNYQGDLRTGENGKFLLHLYYDKYDYYGDYVLDYDGTRTINRDDYGANWWGAEARCSMDFSPRFSGVFGAEYQRAYDLRVSNYDRSPEFYPYTRTISDFNLFSCYVQTDLRILDSLRLVSGVRLDDSSAFGQAWSPRVALIHAPAGSDTALKLLYGRAFRAPNDWERNAYFPDVQITNPNLDPEKIETYEFVYERRLGGRHRLIASIFDFHLDGIITLTAIPDGLQQYQNRGSVDSKGVEVQLESRLGSGSTAYIGLTKLNAWNKHTGGWVSNSPRFLASAGISIPLWSKRFYVAPQVHYVSKRRTLSGGSAPSASVVNLNITPGRLSNNLEISLGVYNLFNQDVYVPGSEEHVQDRIPQDRRTFRFRLARRF